MSASIDIGPYRVEADAHGWTIGEPRIRQSGDMRGDTFLAHQSYYASLEQALAGLQERWLRHSEASGLEDVLSELREYRAELAALFEMSVREPQRTKGRGSHE